MPLQEVRADNSRALQDIADAITKSHKILVVTGAGISTSCGIPDFRSKDGLYNLIPQESMLPTPPSSEPSTPRHKRKASVFDEDDEDAPSSQSSTASRASRVSSNSPASRMKGQDLFHARVFQNSDTTEVFYKFITSLRQKIKDEVKDSSLTHKFIRTLRDGGRLMRCYTQNIDGLEAREGLCLDLTRGKGNKRRFMKKHIECPRPDNVQGTDHDGGCEVVQLHGELTKLRCTVCSTEEQWTDEQTDILLEGYPPKCEKCDSKSQERLATGKRGLTVGGLRPNIVLYGEEHPQNTLLSPFVPYDIASNPDTLIIMGTSLKVHGLQRIIRDFAKAVHSQKNGRVIFVNRTRPAESVWDGIIDDFVEMDCDAWVSDLKSRREDLWFRQGELDLKSIKFTSTAAKRPRKSLAKEMTGEEQADEPIRKKIKAGPKKVISVDIPRFSAMASAVSPAPRRASIARDVEDTPSKKKSSRTTTTNKATSTKWRTTHPNTPTHNLLSPLKRANRPALVSPITPTYSPLTPRRSAAINSRPIAMTPSRLRVVSKAVGTVDILDDENEENTTSSAPVSNLLPVFDTTTHDKNQDHENQEDHSDPKRNHRPITSSSACGMDETTAKETQETGEIAIKTRMGIGKATTTTKTGGGGVMDKISFLGKLVWN